MATHSGTTPSEAAPSIVSMLEGLFPPGVAVAAAEGDVEPEPLYEEEATAVSRAIEKRRREFALGRTCARQALRRIGVSAGPIPVRPDRGPQWPDGVVGTITHCLGLAAAAVARAGDFASLGLDAERADPLEAGLVRLICTEAEQRWIEATGAPPVTNWPKLFFSAKEAVHKAIAPLSGVTLGFREVELDVRQEEAKFTVRLVGRADERLPAFTRLHGRYAITDRYVATSVVARAP